MRTESTTIRPKNQAYNNIELLAKESGNLGLGMAAMDLMGSLHRIAKRAIELKDPVLLEECEHLCLISEDE